MKTAIKFIKHYGCYNPGDVAGFEPDVAKRLTSGDKAVATAYDAKAEAKIAAAKTTSAADIEAREAALAAKEADLLAREEALANAAPATGGTGLPDQGKTKGKTA